MADVVAVVVVGGDVMDRRFLLFLRNLRHWDWLDKGLLLNLLLCLITRCKIHALCEQSCELVMLRLIHASFSTSCEVQSGGSKTALWQSQWTEHERANSKASNLTWLQVCSCCQTPGESDTGVL